MFGLKNNLVFYVKNDQFYLSDVETHELFELTKEEMYCITDVVYDKDLSETQKNLAVDLLEHKILTTKSSDTADNWGWDELSRLFHLSTCNLDISELNEENWFDSYLNYCADLDEQNYIKEEALPDGIKLPEVNLIKDTKLWDVFINRQTSRRFEHQSISLETLASVLATAFGNNKTWDGYDQINFVGKRKFYPSAGGLHSLNFYVVANRVDGLNKGVYRYNPDNHSLIDLGSLDRETLISSVSVQKFIEDMSVQIFVTSDFSKVWWKYPEAKAYKLVMLDAGHCSQTALLSITAHGLLSWVTGALHEDSVFKLLRIYNSTEFPLLCIGMGVGKPDPLSEEMKNILIK